MKKKNIESNITLIDNFTQSENDIIKGGKVHVKGTASVNCKGVSGSVEVLKFLTILLLEIKILQI